MILIYIYIHTPFLLTGLKSHMVIHNRVVISYKKVYIYGSIHIIVYICINSIVFYSIHANMYNTIHIYLVYNVKVHEK